MRALPLAALLLVAPTALAAAVHLPEGRLHEAAVEAGGAATFRVPVVIPVAGTVYAKLLPTDDNAVHDGAAPNGTLVDGGSGWRVAFAWERPDGGVVDLGARVDSRPGAPVPVAEGEEGALRVTVHAPVDALLGGPRQSVYVALAHRPQREGASGAGGSGATRDDAVALHLVLHVAAPGVGDGPPGVEPVPQEEPPGAVVIVEEAALPTWFMVGLLAGVWSLVGLVGTDLVLRHRRRLHRSPAAAAVHRVPVRAPERPTEPPRN